MSEKAARSIGSATISFGLVSVACKIYSATKDNSLSFNLLHKGCGSRLSQQYICQKEGCVVPRADMIKGFEVAKDQYIQFTAEELKSLEEKSTYTIEITEFVPIAKVDPIFFDKPYFLGPDKGGNKAYSLLAEALRRSEKAALARYAARGKQYIVLLRPVADGMIMQTLLYSDEVRTIKDVPLDPVAIKDAELMLALQLVSTLACPDFTPEKYKDEVRERVEAAIQAKIDGKEVTVSNPDPAPQIVDIMEALKASLGMAAQSQV